MKFYDIYRIILYVSAYITLYRVSANSYLNFK